MTLAELQEQSGHQEGSQDIVGLGLSEGQESSCQSVGV